MIIYLAADHAGYVLKEQVKENLLGRGFLVEDFGAQKLDEADDYPDFVAPCVEHYIKRTNGDIGKGFAIVFGGSGTGEAIVANRVRRARAMVFNGNMEVVRLAREHNDANILSIGARFVDLEKTLEAIRIFFSTSFEAGRHARRVRKIDMLK